MYTIRNENGVMIAKVDNKLAAALTLRVPGKWRPYNSTLTGQTRCYEVTEGRTLDTGWGEFFIWVGYLMIEST